MKTLDPHSLPLVAGGNRYDNTKEVLATMKPASMLYPAPVNPPPPLEHPPVLTPHDDPDQETERPPQ
ncbi:MULTISPECIES: hypothetical protein [unclassified Lysobacter]|uniref:hypothetical protein n=1 Tax=unclassified Lysobacter TaxID=2635362 RepID=UPI0006F835EF|nr:MULTISPECIES: hypothetical protein [unclassified Lysobacter]KRA17002.1 hypothetical protein ASD69_09705 [Lysobacter sp. Root604]KRD31535.1 hypothetical protein ASE35_16205 [Lysobacter sp. Root916]